MILVTGASGYVGSHIVQKLVEAKEPVRAMVYNREKALSENRLAGLPIELVEGNVNKPETLSSALHGVSAVVHTVAIAIEKGGRKYETVNYQGTVNTIDAAKKAGVKRFINISQLGADGRLPYRFLASKGKAQEYVAASGLDWTALRPSVIWGPEDEFANTFARLVPLTPLIFPVVGDENSKFQPIWVDDVATCVVKVLADPSTIGKELEIGGPEILTLKEIELRTLQAVGARRTMIPFPMPILKIAVSMMELLLPAPPVTLSLLELLAVPNFTQNNTITQFVPDPRPFKVEYISQYMRTFNIRQTISQFFGRI